ncbi:MAG: substrate-binding domain-containing protein [Eubacteriales bacterium]|nr:substrate-binding domain-containing protein [Eubacteriales bacterium]
MKMKKLLAMLMAGAMCVGMLAGCGSTTDSKDEGTDTKGSAAGTSASNFDGKISFIISNKDEFQSALDQSAKAAAQARGIELTSVDCAADQDRELEAVQAAVQNGADAIVIILADDTRADEVIEAAGDLPVVFVNRTPQDTSVLDEKHVYVGSDENDSGVMQGELLAEAMKADDEDTANYIMLQGTAGLLHTTKRSEGVLNALKEAGITANAVTEPVDCGYDRSAAMDAVLSMIANGQDMSKVNVLIANNDAMALGAIEALRQSEVDMAGIKVVGVDGTNAGLQAIIDGTMTATVFQNATGQATASVQAAINLASGADADENISYEMKDNNIWIPFEKITADNVADYY